jgi:hypothetical protein
VARGGSVSALSQGEGVAAGGSSNPRHPWRPFRSWPSWATLVSRVIAVISVLVIVGTAAGCSSDTNVAADKATTTTAPPTTTAPTTAPPTTAAPTTTAPATTTAESPASTTALSGLASLPVKGRAPLTGYSRTEFGPAWTDDVTVADGHNGCDTRDDILRRDLTDVVIRPGTSGCTVASGVLHDPYTNTVINFTRGIGTSAAVQIDHVVALGDAWQTGAQQLSMAVRTDMANDPLELLAVDGPANEQKGDADAASWLPPNTSFRCSYVAIQVAVKMKYHLWVIPAERAAIAQVLATCPTQPLPSGGPPVVGTAPTPVPSTTPAPAPTTPFPGRAIVHPGAFCSPPGARGITSAGTPMICKLDSTGKRYRWSSA